MIKFFKDLFRFLKDDFISDFKAIGLAMKRHEKGEPIFDQGKVAKWKHELKHWSWYDFFASNFLFFLIVTAAFISGYWVASQDYQDKCNDYIIENYIEPIQDGRLSYNTITDRTVNFGEEVVIGLGLEEIPNMELE